MSTISASTTTTTAYKVTADTTGTLVLQTGSTPTTAVTIDASQNVGIGTSSPSYKLDAQTTLTGTAAGDNTALYVGSLASGRDVNIRLGDSVNASARIGYLSGALYMYTNGAERMRLDTSGNLGLGVTPSAWSSATGLQVQNAAIEGRSGVSSYATLSANGYTQAGTWKYISSDYASRYTQYQGAHLWYTAASGTAGNTISFTQAMTLDANGALGLGDTNPSASAQLSVLTAGNAFASFRNASISTVVGTNNSLGGAIFGTSTAHPVFFYTNGAERARIDSSGNLIVGTTATAGKLGVNLASDTAGTLTVALQNGTNAYQGLRLTSTGNALAFDRYNGSWAESMRIDSSGNLLVGTTSATGKLTVADNNNRSQTDAQFSISGNGYSGFHFLDGNAYHIGQNSPFRSLRIYSGSSSGTGVQLSAGGTSWGTYSDERIKTGLTPIENALSKVNTLRAVTGRYNTDEDTVSRAFLIAQDVQAVLPEAVDEDNDEQKTLTLKYTEVIPLLVAAIKEQQAIIETLTNRITALEAK